MKYQIACLLLLIWLVASCKGKSNPTQQSTSQSQIQERREERREERKQEESTPYQPPPTSMQPPVDVKGPPPNSSKTPSGLAYRVLKIGTGKQRPRASDIVEIHYTGWKTDGTFLDSSVPTGEPARFIVNQTLKGWEEGLQLMVVGEQTRFWIPSELAYNNQPGSPEGMIVFDIELVRIVSSNTETPDVNKIPAGTKKTSSGLSILRISPGTGTKPKETDWVKVHYTSWGTNGLIETTRVSPDVQLLDPTTLVPALKEAVMSMQKGEKIRIWAPAKLAYGETPSRPGAHFGPAVFDIELLSFAPPPTNEPPPSRERDTNR